MTDIWAPLCYQNINWMKTTKSIRGLQIMLFLFESRERKHLHENWSLQYNVLIMPMLHIISGESNLVFSLYSNPFLHKKTPNPHQSILELFGCLLHLLKLSNRSKSCWLDYWQRDTAGFPQEVRLIRLFKRNPKWITFYFQFALYKTKSNGCRTKAFSPFMILLPFLLPYK